jgi:hemoglobin
MSGAPSPYERLGGALGVRKLVTRFYDLMSELPEAREILAMHPAELASSREKLGGPQLYMQRRGHPRLRMRHLPFRIDNAARDAWMLCMTKALDECCEDTLLREQLRGAFQRMADHLRNADEWARPEDNG